MCELTGDTSSEKGRGLLIHQSLTSGIIYALMQRRNSWRDYNTYDLNIWDMRSVMSGVRNISSVAVSQNHFILLFFQMIKVGDNKWCQ